MSSDTASEDSNGSLPSANGWIHLSASNVNYDKVIFIDVPKNYPPQKDIVVSFEMTENVTCNSNDYVGLFHVGFKDVTECLNKKLVEPKDEGAKMNNIVFSAQELPSDESEFYQFLYMRPENCIFGASTPFQFGPVSEDVIAEMSEDDFLIVRSQLKEENTNFKKNIEKLEILLATERQNSGNLLADKEKAVQQALDSATVLQKEKAHVENERNKFKISNKKLESENSIQKATIDNLKKYITTLEDTIAAKNQKLDEDLKVIMTYRTRLSQITNMKLSEGVERRKIAEIEAATDNHLLRQTLEEKDAQLSAIMDSKNLVVAELTSQNEKFTAAQDELAGLKKEMENLSELRHKDVEEICIKNAKIEELHAENVTLLEETEKKNVEMEKLRKKNTQMNELMRNDEEEIQFLTKRKDDLEALVDKLEDVLKQDDLELKKSEAEKVDMQDILIALEDSLEKERMKVKDLETELALKIEVAENKPNNTESIVIEELKARLLEGAEIYKQQFFEIKKLQKRIKDLEAENKKKEPESSGASSPKSGSDVEKTVECSKNRKTEYVSDDETGKNPSKGVNTSCPPINDSDTGEHVAKLQCAPTLAKKSAEAEDVQARTSFLEIFNKSRDDKRNSIPRVNDSSSKIGQDKSSFPVPIGGSWTKVLPTKDSAGVSRKHASTSTKSSKSTTKNAAAPTTLQGFAAGAGTHSAHEHHLGAPYGVYPAYTDCARGNYHYPPAIPSFWNAMQVLGKHHQPSAYTCWRPMTHVHAHEKKDEHVAQQAAPFPPKCDPWMAAPSNNFDERKWHHHNKANGEIQYLPLACPICSQVLFVYGDDPTWMWEHLEAVHKQKCCPVCGGLFDMTLPSQYFKYHVESHFG